MPSYQAICKVHSKDNTSYSSGESKGYFKSSFYELSLILNKNFSGSLKL
uniref:Uncharacterized protein n=1 Tax=Arundo donax TaxID=35708 RepID=A0A0A9EL43_ARUDO